LDAFVNLYDHPGRPIVEERAVLHLVYVGKHSRQDIVFIMNISCESVDMHLGNARRLFRSAEDVSGVAHDQSREARQAGQARVATE
jgi:DNA-directed RNA polymerase specialized sigma24 family protein